MKLAAHANALRAVISGVIYSAADGPLTHFKSGSTNI